MVASGVARRSLPHFIQLCRLNETEPAECNLHGLSSVSSIRVQKRNLNSLEHLTGVGCR